MKPRTHRSSRTFTRRFNTLALALALSAGTIGGMAVFADSAGAQSQIATIDVSKSDSARIEAANPPAAAKTEVPHCGGGRDANTRQCVPSYRPAPRVVNIHGFANCSKVQQVASANGQPAKFECARPM